MADSKQLRLIFLGPAGAGKGTQVCKLTNKHRILSYPYNRQLELLKNTEYVICQQVSLKML